MNDSHWTDGQTEARVCHQQVTADEAPTSILLYTASSQNLITFPNFNNFDISAPFKKHVDLGCC